MRYLLGQMVRRAILVNVLALAIAGGVMAAGPEKAIPGPDKAVRIVAFGDSLTAGYGLQPGQGFPEQLGKLLSSRGVKAEIVNAGVSGFVLKDASFEEFVATIRSVAAGEKVLPPRMTETLFAQIAKDAVHRGDEVIDDVRLTRREREVIDLIGEGLSNKEIAQRLNIATHTVKSHVRNVMEKLTLHTRLQISAYYHREGSA